MRKICYAAHPDLVGARNVEAIEINDGDEGASGVATAFAIATIPANSVLQAVYTQVAEAPDSGTSDLLTVGRSGATDAYQDAGDINEGAAAVYTDTVSGALPAVLTSETTINLYWTSTGTAPTQGKVRAFVEWTRLAL